MTRQLPYYVIAAAILIVGLVAVGVPVGNLLFVGLILLCLLMMLFMMRGMGAGRADHTASKEDDGPQKHEHQTRVGR